MKKLLTSLCIEKCSVIARLWFFYIYLVLADNEKICICSFFLHDYFWLKLFVFLLHFRSETVQDLQRTFRERSSESYEEQGMDNKQTNQQFAYTVSYFEQRRRRTVSYHASAAVPFSGTKCMLLRVQCLVL